MMMMLRSCALVLLLITVSSSFAQSWSAAYEAGLKAAGQNNWLEARKAFQQAAAMRTEDVSAPTLMPGPPTEDRRWRGGAAYSPNFLAAYSLYRAGLGMTDQAEQVRSLNQAAEELETLLAKGQYSKETFYVLNAIYTRTGNVDKRQALEAKYLQAAGKLDWRVDTEVVSPEELAALAGTQQQPVQPGTGPKPTDKPEVIKAGDPRVSTPGTTSGVSLGSAPVGAVAIDPNKYALIIGNSESRIQEGMIPHAADDAQRMREALTSHAGYADANVDLVLNATASQIMASAKALADRVPQDGTVLIYFAGAGSNVNGRDYLAGVDTELGTDAASMVPKAELFRLFMVKGASIFAFFEVNRPIVNGTYFGKEIPLTGRVSQMQATMPGSIVTSYIRNGKNVGIFTDAFANVLADLRSNRLPIMETGWQVFYKMRRGDTGVTGGASQQTPTLPVLTNLAADARF